MKKRLIIYPFLFGIYPILSLYVNNLKEALISDLFFPILIVLIITVPLFLLIRFFLGSFQKSALLVFGFYFLFFSYGYAAPFLIWSVKSIYYLHPLFRHLLLLFTLFIIPLFLGILYLFKTRRRLDTITKFLNRVSIILIVIPLLHIGYLQIRSLSALRRSENKSSINAGNNIFSREESIQYAKNRDIYYIILDGYGSESVLRKYYNYENSAFLNWLRQKGFYISSASRSNYIYSIRSMPSSLNMDYLHDLDNLRFSDIPNYSLKFFKISEEGKAIIYLKNKGYRYIQIDSSGFLPSITLNQTISSRYNQLLKSNEFSMALLKTTVLAPMAFVLIANIIRHNILYTFEALETIPDIDAPTFTFAHFAIPHPPYVFGTGGEKYSFAQIILREGMKKKEYYVEQLTFLNKKLIKLIDILLEKSESPPIIILQGDHGPRPRWRGDITRLPQPEEGEFINYADEVTGILNAYYLPDVDKEDILYPSITPVNTFRVVLKSYFNAPMELLADRNYILRDHDHLYEFTDITDKIKSSDNISKNK